MDEDYFAKWQRDVRYAAFPLACKANHDPDWVFDEDYLDAEITHQGPKSYIASAYLCANRDDRTELTWSSGETEQKAADYLLAKLAEMTKYG
jgi:hypothetical protein